MRFLVPNYSCLQNPWLGGYHPPDPHSLCPQLNLLNHPPKKIPGYATVIETSTGAALHKQTYFEVRRKLQFPIWHVAVRPTLTCKIMRCSANCMTGVGGDTRQAHSNCMTGVGGDTRQAHSNCMTGPLRIEPTDALNSNLIGTATLHVAGSLSAHHQEFLAVHRLWYILCSCDRLLPGAGWKCYDARS